MVTTDEAEDDIDDGQVTAYAMRHPLHLFDEFLSSLPPLTSTTSFVTDHQSEDMDARFRRRQDLILHVADELLGWDRRGGGGIGSRTGHDRGSTLLENALALLDDKQVTEQSEIPGVGGTATLRWMRAKRSGREIFLFRKQHGSNSKAKKVSASSVTLAFASAGEITPEEYYICLLPRLDRRSLAGVSFGTGFRDSSHCTCRSFLHNIIAGVQSERRHCHETQSVYVVTCKHILAAKLMPHLLSSGGSERTSTDYVEVVDDQFFARLVMLAGAGIS